MRAGDFIAARRRLEAKPKAIREKVTSAAEAASLARDGDHVALGGCLFSRPPILLVRELLRQGRRQLTLSRNLMGFEGELFMVAGAVEAVVTSWMALGVPWGVSKVVRHYVESGLVRFEEWSHLALGLRYHAGAMGVPFLPTLSMLGSDLLRQNEARTMQCPFTGETVCLVPALFPDVALLHVHRADRFGNCQIDGYPHMDADLARAASTVLVTAEQIIDDEEVRRHPERTVIPGIVVDAVVEAPFGAFPGECYGLYETDFSHFDAYVAGINARGLDSVREYLEHFVYGPATHQEYLRLFDPEVLARQQRAARELVGAP
ncbi:MAG: CoA transferase subunit A [Chloroflexi bacterium]|nr:CoA transferase subunit A [Chloroflexota bacterium]